MADPSSERFEEIERLEDKREKLDKLIDRAIGNVLKANTAEQAKEAIFETLFFNMALYQLEGARSRLLGQEEEAGDFGIWSTQNQRFLEGIAEGDWVMAKDEVEGLISVTIGDEDIAESYELDTNFTYKGRQIFKDTSDESQELFLEFLKNQVYLVPDKTEQFRHPKLEILKTQVASI